MPHYKLIALDDDKPQTVPHILEEGSHYHVKWYDTNGVHCNVSNCEINQYDKPPIERKRQRGRETR